MESSSKLLLKLCHSLFWKILISISAPNSPVIVPMTTHHVLPNRHLRLQKTKKMMKMDQCTSHSSTLGKARARTWGMTKDT